MLPRPASGHRTRVRGGRAAAGPAGGWEEAGDAFDERERAALALTEPVLVLTGDASQASGRGGGFVPDEVYARAARRFDTPRLVRLLALIVAISNGNRMMVSRRIPPGGHTP